jgi:hypothetical protein
MAVFRPPGIERFCRLTGGKTRFRRLQGEQVWLIALAIALLLARDKSKGAASSFGTIRVTTTPP